MFADSVGVGIDIYERDGLIRAADLAEAGDDVRYLRDEYRRGALVRLRRGVYCTAANWQQLDGAARHRLHVRAALATLESPLIVAGRSAATMWHLPGGARWPQPVTLLGAPRGGGTTSPGVRISTTIRDAVEHEIDGVPCTGLARTAVDVARLCTVPEAVAILDAVRDRRRPDRIGLDVLAQEVGAAGSARGVSVARRALALSSDRSESVGESRARIAIHRLGFIAPELQREFADRDGSMFVDFYWSEVDVAVEYDGKVKYTRQEYTGGNPSEVVWKEKQREDRLRRQVRKVDRIVTYDVERPSRLDAILRDAGVPRRPRARRRTS